MRTLLAFLRLSRPHFLLGGALMFGFGAAASGAFDATGYVLGQLMVTAAQVTAHYVNEHADIVADRTVVHRTMFSGGSGVLSSGELAPSVALRAAAVSSVVAVGAAGLLATRSVAAAALGLAALAVSWAYSAPPLRLLATGFGELATSAVVTGFVPLIGALSQGGSPSTTLWWGIGVLFPIHVAMMLGFEIPDIASDAAAGKTVIAVRIGRTRTGWIIGALIAAATAAALGGAAAGGIAHAALLSPALPAAASFVDAVPKDRHGRLTALGVATFVLAGAGLTAGALL